MTLRQQIDTIITIQELFGIKELTISYMILAMDRGIISPTEYMVLGKTFSRLGIRVDY